MATNMQSPFTRATAQPLAANRHLALRATLVAIGVFLLVTTVAGAIFVVPGMPRDMLAGTPFTDYTIPALALGVLCGGSALAAVIGVIVRPWLGGLASMVAGAMIIGFEIVEILAIGFTATADSFNPASWLQVFYLGIGAAVMFLGFHLWQVETDAWRQNSQ